MRYLLATFLLVSCFGSTPEEKVPEAGGEEICVPSAVTEEKDLQISWTAIKNGDVPVDGTLDGKGKIILPVSGLKGTRITLTFDPLTIATGIELRDSRIASIFFESATITFSGQIAAIDDNTLPDDGETRNVTVTGTLMMAGNGVAATAYAIMTNKAGTIDLTDDGSRPSNIDVTATQGLKANVQKLLKAASVSSMESNVAIHGTLPIVKTCD